MQKYRGHGYGTVSGMSAGTVTLIEGTRVYIPKSGSYKITVAGHMTLTESSNPTYANGYIGTYVNSVTTYNLYQGLGAIGVCESSSTLWRSAYCYTTINALQEGDFVTLGAYVSESGGTVSSRGAIATIDVEEI